MGLSHSPKIVTNGLVMYLDAGNTKSYPGTGTTWTDMSVSKNNGTLNDSPTYSGGSLVFDGTANRVHSSSSYKWSADGTVGYQTMTISLWIKSTDIDGRYFSKPWNSSGDYNIGITPSSFSLLSGTTGTTTNSIAIDASIYDGTWKNIVCWMNATNMGYYLNNTISSSKAHLLSGATPTLGDGNVSLCLMSLFPYNSPWAGNATFSINGNMAICKIYNRVLSAEEVQQNFNALRGRFSI